MDTRFQRWGVCFVTLANAWCTNQQFLISRRRQVWDKFCIHHRCENRKKADLPKPPNTLDSSFLNFGSSGMSDDELLSVIAEAVFLWSATSTYRFLRPIRERRWVGIYHYGAFKAFAALCSLLTFDDCFTLFLVVWAASCWKKGSFALHHVDRFKEDHVLSI